MSSTEVVPWGEQFVRNREERRRRERRLNRTLWGTGAVLSAAIVFGSMTVALSRSSESAGAAVEPVPETTAATLAPEWMAPTTTALAPTGAPTPTIPQRMTARVQLVGWDGLGVLETDGKPGRGPRILPGEVGRAVIAVPFDPTGSNTVVVEGVQWNVFHKGQVGANDRAGITGPVPERPVVLIYSSLPGDMRPYIEATR